MASTHRQQVKILKQHEQILTGISNLEKRMSELSRLIETTTIFDVPAEIEPESEPELTAKEKREAAKAEKAQAKEEELFAALAADNTSSNLSD